MNFLKNKFRIALIGAGKNGLTWADAIRKNKKSVLAAVVDVDLAKAKAIASGDGNFLTESNHKKLLGNPNIDGAIITTPHKFLAPITFDFLKAKKHALCEKPGGIESREIKKNLALAKKNKLAYMVGFNKHFHPAYMLAKKKFEAGEIGKLLFIRARYGLSGGSNFQKEWRLNKEISGGGELIDQGVHMIDMSRYFMDNIKDIKGLAPALFWHKKTEDNAFVLLQDKSGAVSFIHVSWTNWNWIHSFEIFGDKGYLIIEGLDQRYQGPERLIIGERHPKFKVPPEEKIIKFKNEQKSSSLIREIDEFTSAIRENRQPALNGQDAYETLKIVEQIYKNN
ncbi:MAG: Gfo/Idh/MocA family oxidoreductase [Parcubacteria group bacterium]|nr:Gfo/Idh/MocA family oxidoreductase [Parcubacteria group bacterium]